MNGALTFVTFILAFTAILSVGIAAFSWQRRHAGQWAYPFVLLSLGMACWTVLYLFELRAASLEGKVFWARTEYFAIVSIPVFWFLFAMVYTGRQKWLSRSRVLLLFVVPLMTVILVWTNGLHGLIWKAVPLLESGPFPVLAPVYGLGFALHTAYSYVLMFLGTLALIQLAYQSPQTFRWQNLTLVMGALIPWLANIIYLFDLGIFPNIDMSPIAFVLSGLVLALSIFRLHLFDVVPVAHRVAVNTMHDGVIVLDNKNRVVDMNPAALAVFETQLTAVVGKPVAVLLADWPILVEKFQDVWSVETEVCVQSETGNHYFALQIAPLLGSQRRLNGRLVVFHNITVYKNTEMELAAARDQALTVSRVKTELLARVSHELRTPLNVILGYSEMLQLGLTGPITQKQYDTLDKILVSTHFLTDQVNDLLNLSSIETGSIRLHYHTFSIVEVIHEIIEKWQEEADNKSLQLVKVDSPQSLENVYGDRNGVTQILTNLVGNAIKFSTKGIIQIAALPYDAQFWAMRVTDEGPGIPPEAYDLIFEPFRQIDGSMTRIHGGTGLGLAIVKQMTALMGGTIQLESELGQGSTFTILLPHKPERTLRA